jgi:hypothetical protein
MMKVQSVFVRLWCFWLVFLFGPSSDTKVQAQSCSSCGWESDPFYYETYDSEGCATYYYEEINYYYCGQYQYSRTYRLGEYDPCR